MQNRVIWFPDCTAGSASLGPVTNSPSRAAPRSGVLFSGPAHAEFRFWYLKFPPPKSLLGRPIPHGASVRKGAQRGKTLWRLVGPRAQWTKGVPAICPNFLPFVNELSNHRFQSAIKFFHKTICLWVIGTDPAGLVSASSTCTATSPPCFSFFQETYTHKYPNKWLKAGQPVPKISGCSRCGLTATFTPLSCIALWLKVWIKVDKNAMTFRRLKLD